MKRRPQRCHSEAPLPEGALTSRILSSSISLKTVPLIWLGLSATQLKTGIRNFVLIGFLILTAGLGERRVVTVRSPSVRCAEG